MVLQVLRRTAQNVKSAVTYLIPNVMKAQMFSNKERLVRRVRWVNDSFNASEYFHRNAPALDNRS